MDVQKGDIVFFTTCDFGSYSIDELEVVDIQKDHIVCKYVASSLGADKRWVRKTMLDVNIFKDKVEALADFLKNY